MKVKVVAEGDYDTEGRENPLLKAKIYYFSNDWKKSCSDFIKENKKRGYDVSIDDISCYTWD